MECYELTLNNDPGALAHVVALVTGRRWKLGSLHLPASEEDRRLLQIELGGKPEQVEVQLAKLYDVLSVRRVLDRA